jgi:hypothetical protein
MSYIHKDMYISFNIHTFNNITHNFNEIYKCIINYEIYFELE